MKSNEFPTHIFVRCAVFWEGGRNDERCRRLPLLLFFDQGAGNSKKSRSSRFTRPSFSLANHSAAKPGRRS